MPQPTPWAPRIFRYGNGSFAFANATPCALVALTGVTAGSGFRDNLLAGDAVEGTPPAGAGGVSGGGAGAGGGAGGGGGVSGRASGAGGRGRTRTRCGVRGAWWCPRPGPARSPHRRCSTAPARPAAGSGDGSPRGDARTTTSTSGSG